MGMVQVRCANKRCTRPFFAREADRKRGWGRFCSKSCKAVKQEARTGQYAAFQQRSQDRFEEDCHEEAMNAMEEGWDGHKVWTS